MSVEGRPRAQRFPLQLPLRYRESGSSAWSTATTQNISDSGLLIDVERALKVGAVVELEIRMSHEQQRWPSQVSATGSVVRIASVPPEANLRLVAVKFLKSEVVESQSAKA